MPRWARFLSCTLTGLLISLTSFLMAAYWYEGGGTFWAQVAAFLVTSEFVNLVLLFGFLTAFTVLLGRAAANLYGMAGGAAGFVAGAGVSLAYGAFLISAQSADWGGLMPALQRVWPAVGYFVLPFALGGTVATWLWERLG